MKTIELTLVTIGTGVLYASYVYYLLESGNDTQPHNLWYTIGKGLDEFFFNSGIKPKEEIMNSPGKIQQYIDNQ